MERRSARILRMLNLPENKNVSEADLVGRQSSKLEKETVNKIKILSQVIVREKQPEISLQSSKISSSLPSENFANDSTNNQQIHPLEPDDLNYDSFSEDKTSGSEYLPSDDKLSDEESSTSIKEITEKENIFSKVEEPATSTTRYGKEKQRREKSNNMKKRTKTRKQEIRVQSPNSRLHCIDPVSSSTSVSNSNVNVNISAARKNEGKRIRNKGHACYFCQNRVLNFARHLEVMHHRENEVAKLLAMPKNSKNRRDGFIKLIRAGDFYHNIEVLSTKTGELILVRRPTENEFKFAKFHEYGPCPHCLGFMLKKHLWHHIKISCNSKRVTETGDNKLIIAESNAILNDTFGAEFSNDFVVNITSKLRDDDVGQYSKNDNLILQFGAMQFEKYGTTQCELIRQSMRQLSRFVLKLREIDCGNKSLMDYLVPEKFDLIVRATKLLCVSHQNVTRRPEFDIPSLALKIGYALKKCAAIKRGSCLKTGNIRGNETLLSFLSLMELEWSIRISSNALVTLQNRKLNTTQLLPVTGDLIKLSQYIDTNMKIMRDSLSNNPTTQNWTRLALLCLSKIILFNKRRSGESSRMTITDYSTRPKWGEQCTDELKQSLTEMERKLAELLTMVEIIGKRGRRVPVLLTVEAKKSIDLLLKTREQVDICKDNPHVFARTGSSMGSIRGHDCLRKCCLEAYLEHPENITSTKLRKYIATVCQVFNLSENEYDWLARHLGHDIRVHRDYYRLHESAVELTKVSRLLITVDNGEVNKFAGKKLEDINLSDLPNLDEDEAESDADNDEELELNNQQDDHVNHVNKEFVALPAPRNVQPKRSKKGVKRPWSLEEKNAILKFFKRDIIRHAVPGKASCMQCIEQNPVLVTRNWTDVKFSVKNQIDKIKRKSTKTNKLF